MMLMRSVIQEHVAGWMAPAVTAAFTDAAAFANAIGLTFLSELCARAAAAKKLFAPFLP